jgi:hypothetical protein
MVNTIITVLGFGTAAILSRGGLAAAARALSSGGRGTGSV